MTTALAVEAVPIPSYEDVAEWPAHRVVSAARRFGRLRSVEPHQAAIVVRAAEYAPDVLPKWQRFGEGHHESAAPGDYAQGLVWRRVRRLTRAADGHLYYRVPEYTGRPHIAWQTRYDWLSRIVTAAIEARPEALHTRSGRIAPKRLLQWCRIVSLHAHYATGRRCIVRVDRLAEQMGVNERTVQRAQEAAETLGLYVVLRPARMLTEEEKRGCQDRGSLQRGLANEAALVVPAWLLDEGRLEAVTPGRIKATIHSTTSPLPHPSTENVTPFHRNPRFSSHLRLLVPSKERTAGISEPPTAARQRKKGLIRAVTPVTRRRTYDPNALEVARDLIQTLPWLHTTAPGRIEPMLRRFASARAPWTARDVIRVLDATNTRLNRPAMTPDTVRHPIGLLAHYLRDLDPQADHPLGPDYLNNPWPRTKPPSPTQQANQARIAAEHARRNAATPEQQAAWVTQARADLQARKLRKSDSSEHTDSGAP